MMSKSHLFKISAPVLVAVCSLFGVHAPVQAAPAAAATAQSGQINPAAAQAFIKTLSDRAFAVLRDKSITPAAREARFRQLLSEGFNLDYISLFVLGPARRDPKTTNAQVAEYQAAFPVYVIKIYANRLTDYSDTNLKVTGAQAVGSRGDLMVRTQVSGPGVQQPVLADWRVRNFPSGGLKIIDLTIAGVSMVSTQREEFQTIVQQRGMDGLIMQIREQSDAPAPKGKSAAK